MPVEKHCTTLHLRNRSGGLKCAEGYDFQFIQILKLGEKIQELVRSLNSTNRTIFTQFYLSTR
ncbi:hypothetical protein NIES4073_48420 [Kalymmatonema gypsitolerans NIES-4073]|nr:hypothetical protein NIES4073_48420 [Scytonema sp. NIES-4073]